MRISTSTLDAEETGATTELVSAAWTTLPPKWRQALDPRIELGWRDDLPEHVHGRVRGRRLRLDRDLLDDWVAAGGSGPARRAALATLIHELAHVYDRSPDGGLSRDPRLLDLAGWQVGTLRLGLRSGRNAFSDRSPDLYELEDPAEFVAVNLEYFLLDPEYACRRPALHRYFASQLEVETTPVDCAPGFAFMSTPDGAEASPLQRIDVDRVYRIDYLLAEPNQQMMSRWGHSMLRLVICAPGRPRGPDCGLDLQHHRVLSFRAFVDDVQVSGWRGLTGSYPSRLFVLPLEQVIDEYTRTELRGLRSTPLRLQRDEIAGLLERAARLHWSYDGRYYFLSNNCATETFKLLHDGVPRLAGKSLASITPTGLLRRLRETGVADDSMFDDPERAVRLGYRFEALSSHYQAMFEIARRALPLPQSTVEAWLDAPASERARWLDSADLRTSAALLLLEQAALRREELRAREDLKRQLLARTPARPHPGPGPDDGSAPLSNSGPGSGDARAMLEQMLQSEGHLSRPAALLPDTGYGLPQADERSAIEAVGNGHAARWWRQRETLVAAARRWLPAARRETLDGIQANVDTLGRRLRQLHADTERANAERADAERANPERAGAERADGQSDGDRPRSLEIPAIP
ncbi:DUF4105 domain-containing protein [Lysobacter maris]|uniref:DUF4105 domain-containing protein n=2 Tax=Marilutibacter maris TaxID=1605891 RepID=A0A508B3V5_9GAMM|nr:DUF4105 domain-containing protein [Lysobacter maris]